MSPEIKATSIIIVWFWLLWFGPKWVASKVPDEWLDVFDE